MIYRLAFVLLSFLIQPCFASEKADNASREETQIYHVYDDVNLVSTLNFTYAKPGIVIKSVYPQLESNEPSEGMTAFNNSILDIIHEEIDSFKAQVAKLASTQKKIKGPVKNNLYIDYNTSVVQSEDTHIASIRFNIQGFIAGMAHPMHYYRVFNYDLENNKPITLPDLFVPNSNYLQVLSNYTKHQLYRRLVDKKMIAQGTAPREENFQNWNIKSTGIIITFPEYQVAPYVNGAQTVLVPYAVLQPIISPTSSIAGCLNKNKRCRRSNLLTGGFID